MIKLAHLCIEKINIVPETSEFFSCYMVYEKKKLLNAFKSTSSFGYSKIRHADLVVSEAMVYFNKMSQAGLFFFLKRYLFSISFCPSMKFRTLLRLSMHFNTWLHMEPHGNCSNFHLYISGCGTINTEKHSLELF